MSGPISAIHQALCFMLLFLQNSLSEEFKPSLSLLSSLGNSLLGWSQFLGRNNFLGCSCLVAHILENQPQNITDSLADTANNATHQKRRQKRAHHGRFGRIILYVLLIFFSIDHIFLNRLSARSLKLPLERLLFNFGFGCRQNRIAIVRSVFHFTDVFNNALNVVVFLEKHLFILNVPRKQRIHTPIIAQTTIF